MRAEPDRVCVVEGFAVVGEGEMRRECCSSEATSNACGQAAGLLRKAVELHVPKCNRRDGPLVALQIQNSAGGSLPLP